MENVLKTGKMPYCPYGPLKPLSTEETIQLYFSTFVDLIKVLVIGVPLLIWNSIKWFFPKAKKNVRGQLALVTGGANGIGKLMAIELAKVQCNVVIVDMDEEQGKKTAAMLEDNYFVKSKFYKTNVGDPDEVAQLRKDVERDIGFVDILINNAGVMPLLSLREGTNEEVEFICDTNMNSNIWTCRTFLGGMIERKRGHILATASLCSAHGCPYAVIYSGTKYFVKGFMDALREQIRQDGHSEYIKLTRVHPYFVATRKDLMEAIDLRFPPVTPEDTAKIAIEALLTDQFSASSPKYLNRIQLLTGLFPLCINQLVRDILFKEHTSNTFKNVKKIES